MSRPRARYYFHSLWTFIILPDGPGYVIDYVTDYVIDYVINGFAIDVP